jgi:exodeoxyribonuclease V alpha subunit
MSAGLVERVTFFNPERGFCVLRARSRAAGSSDGSRFVAIGTADGWWVRDKEHGLQLKARILKTIPPTTSEGVERYLASGFVKRHWPSAGEEVGDRFGAEVLAVIFTTNTLGRDVEPL